MKKIIIKVTGLVQGVFFRYTTRKVARKLGLKGYVKNMPDGTVYIEAEGEENDLKQLLKFANTGPPHAKVENVEYEIRDADNKYKGFEYAY
ncbi:MAG: acylphosphatase [Candidatus Lokiarchaeota archaeon]|nr:acylphosphatase [Candidatus Lokiarchaeota archaeon]